MRIEGREVSSDGERCARRYVWGWRCANWDGGRERAEAVFWPGVVAVAMLRLFWGMAWSERNRSCGGRRGVEGRRLD